MANLCLAWGALILLQKDFFVAGIGIAKPLGPLSNCGGSTPWKCPYITFEWGTGCPEASLANASECRAAAQTLGYTVARFHEVLESHEDRGRPPGCSIGYGPVDKSLSLKRDQVYFNKDAVGYGYGRAYLSICRNRVEVMGSFGVGRDFPLGSRGRGTHGGRVEDVPDSSRCCSSCWKAAPGTQMYEYHAGPEQYLSRTANNVCRCLFKQPHQTLVTAAVERRQSTGICAKEYTICIPGDNVASTEMFIQENQYPPHSNCRDICQVLYPASVGMTESRFEKYSHGKRKCWCEFGAKPEVRPDERYRTCLFDRHFQTAQILIM